MKATLRLALMLIAAGCGGSSAPSTPTAPPPVQFVVPPGVSPMVRTMFEGLPGFLQAALAENQANLPRNPQNASFIAAKIALLQRPALAAEMANGRMFAEVAASSIDGRQITIAVLFAEERLRGEAQQTIERMRERLPILERFMDTPFPFSEIGVWYGFKVGNSGGSGAVHTEDRTTYESRTPPTRLPFDAILAHEMGHSYIGNETLTQFLEIYVHNRALGGGDGISTWTYTRGYGGMNDANADSALVLDVYGLMGPESMSRAFKSAYSHRPPYGQPLSPGVVQAFVDQAPDGARTLVAAKLSRITF